MLAGIGVERSANSTAVAGDNPAIAVVRVAAQAPLPERWQQGATVVGRGIVLGVLPLGQHKLFFERVDPQTRQIQTRESNRWVRRWDHLISVNEAPGSRTYYRDDIEIQAGPLTPIVWLFAQWFYRHRQHRWRRMAPTAPGRLISKSSRLPQGVDARPSFQHAAVRPDRT